MEIDENNEVEEQDSEEGVEIYSRRAVFWFFMLLGPLFGGILLMLNLKEAGYKKAINIIFFFILLFDIASELLMVAYVNYFKIDLLAYQKKLLANKGDFSVFDEKITIFMGLFIGLRIIGGFVLTRYFFKKYFPDDDYYPKSIVNVLFISIFAFLLLKLVGIGDI